MSVCANSIRFVHHTLILSERYRGLIDVIFARTSARDFSCSFMHHRDPTIQAPAGCEKPLV
jgi:hypothetical protein